MREAPRTRIEQEEILGLLRARVCRIGETDGHEWTVRLRENTIKTGENARPAQRASPPGCEIDEAEDTIGAMPQHQITAERYARSDSADGSREHPPRRPIQQQNASGGPEQEPTIRLTGEPTTGNA